ncbi:MAG TPA: exodeoxyribonuclease VII large subunit, partial [Usitatibacter sp.]|nr:exodeoxyribonuclease VII large subunit [Usitatibacter sp.]
AQRLARERERLLQAARRLRRAAANVESHRRELERMRERLHAAFARGSDSRTRRLAAARTALVHLDPTQVLARGYAIVRDANGHVVVASRTLATGDALDIAFSEGAARVTVRERH